MVTKHKRILVLLPVDAPSSLVRGSVYQTSLSQDFDTTVARLFISHLAAWRTRAAGARPGLRRLATAPFDAAIIATRATLSEYWLRRASRFDAIWLIKYFDSRFVSRLRHTTNAKILYDIDDAVWLPEFIGEREFERVCELVDSVSCDNEYLRQRALPHNKNAFVLRGPVRLLPFEERPSQRPTVIAWIGSPSTLHYLRNLEAPLARLAQTLPSA